MYNILKYYLSSYLLKKQPLEYLCLVISVHNWCTIHIEKVNFHYRKKQISSIYIGNLCSFLLKLVSVVLMETRSLTMTLEQKNVLSLGARLHKHIIINFGNRWSLWFKCVLYLTLCRSQTAGQIKTLHWCTWCQRSS